MKNKIHIAEENQEVVMTVSEWHDMVNWKEESE